MSYLENPWDIKVRASLDRTAGEVVFPPDAAPRRIWRTHLCLVLVAWLAGPIFTQGANDPKSETPTLFPDYEGIVIPPNIAPLNFRVQTGGRPAQLRLQGPRGQPILLTSRNGGFQIPARPWRQLLRDNEGDRLVANIQIQNAAGQWEPRLSFTNEVARDPIDNHLVYRLLKPLYNYYFELGIYQRDLESFEERPVLQNSSFRRGCLNCHSFLNQQPDTFGIQIRSQAAGNPLLLVVSNEVSRVARTSGYMAWHPSGRLLAYSANRLSIFFHTYGECRDVFDAESNLGIYRVDSNTVVIPPVIAQTNRQETWPAWSPDGRFLYFCSGPKLPQEQYRDVRYDLMRVPYDLAADRWGEPEVLVSAQSTGLSSAQPRISPDGRFVLFCLCPYGHFTIYQPGSDLHLLDLKAKTHRRLQINSQETESWHCWSSNSRWVVFSSKRMDGVFARPHFSHVDESGNFSKPFLLPQKDPWFYDSFMKTYNVPELIRGPITIPSSILAESVFRPRHPLRPKLADSQSPESEESQQTEGALPAGSGYSPSSQ